MAAPYQEAEQGEDRSLRDHLDRPLESLRQRLQDSNLSDLKAKATVFKHKIGKIQNLVNPNHLHDEEHEKETDERRAFVAKSHRFESFAPLREANKIKWLFLLRLNVHKKQSISKIGGSLLKSAHSKHALEALCPEGTPGFGNIKVMRHPDHNVFENAADMTFYWAHHEKFIVIDYNLAFIGGLDLCFGRWDSRQHSLTDLHPEGIQNEVWPGQDFNNCRVMDFQNVMDWNSNLLNKADYGRMPWHDVHMGVIGDCVYDIAEHFILRWNFCKRDKYKHSDKYDWLMLKGREGPDEKLIGVQRPTHPMGQYIQHPLGPIETKNFGPQGTVNAQIVRSSCDWSSGILTEHSIQTAYCDIIRNAQHYVYIENQFFITATGDKQFPIYNTIGKAIVDACVRASKEGRKFRVICIIPAIPGFAGNLNEEAATGTRAIMDYQYKSICRGEYSIMQQIAAQGVDPKNADALADHIFFFNLRIFDRLNKTPVQVEKPGVPHQNVQRTQAGDIMGSTTGGGGERVGEAGYNQGAPSVDPVAASAMLHGDKAPEAPWTGNPEPGDHTFIQEELYIHSKLLIVDDRVVICGSANLNDRSQLGSRDSELAIVMEDTRTINSMMDGQPYVAGHHAATLRRFLWREHLGLLPPQDLNGSNDANAQPPGDCDSNIYGGEEDGFVADPLDDQLWELWTGNATRNTDIFRDLFHADPDDCLKSFQDYSKFLPKGIKQGHLYDPSRTDVKEKLKQIRGHLVWMPLDFLKDSQMAETGLQVNAITESIYT
ncbi:hypothetical protein FGG08_002725 [Glutinoglossum americanum]|uniref:phospholipase D n=1 Tax=Glutinoglossum americanum TaxID=1670608 RepID=A0A9P8I469_9PEZI|nr:hypothetical protein FGG08_002725 [Glutinoglossum americanum]